MVVSPLRGGVEYYRLKTPFEALAEQGLDVILIDRIGTTASNNGTEININDILKEVSTVWFSRVLDVYGQHKKVADIIHNAGAKIVLDIDDYWNLPPDHVLNFHYKKYQIPAQIIECIKLSDMVVTTHSLLAAEIERINPNVVICQNAIPADSQWTPKPTISDKVRFGWVGGVCHQPDLELMRSSINKVYRSEFKNKVQFFLCGYNREENRKLIDKKGNVSNLPVSMETYNQYESVLTSDYMISPEYYSYLRQMTVTPNKDVYFEDEIYQRRWAKDVTDFATFYNEFDVALIPLKENYFNRCKSELKAIEAGWMGKSVIASNLHPYTNILNEKNSCLVKGNEWLKHIRKLTTQPKFREDIAAQLQADVKEKYSLGLANRVRIQILNHFETENKRSHLPERATD